MSILCAWGDLSVGTTGVVSLREGEEAVLLGHFFGMDMGATEMAVARTTVVGTVGSNSHREILAVDGAVVGTAFFNSPNGVYAVFGASPQAIRLTTKTSADHGHCSRSYSIARHFNDGQVEFGVRAAMTHAMEDVRLAPGAEYECEVRVTRGDTDEELNGEDFVVSGVANLVDASLPTGTLLDKVIRMVADSAAVEESVHVSFFLAELD